MSPEEVRERYDDFQGKFTKTAQEKKELEQKLEELQQKVQDSEVTSATQKAVQEADIPDDVKFVLDKYTRSSILPLVKQEINREFSTKAQRDQFEETCQRLEKEFDGKDGKPKFDPVEDKEWLKKELTKPTQTIFDAWTLYESKVKDDILNWKIEEALKQKSGTARTERTGGSASGDRKPESKAPDNWKDAKKSALQRLTRG